ncbi:MAG: isopentenyl phosphate kinase family protein [Anaerolineae bacterium]|nr:MAG: isopentenyl phosphate kinase family protein [Anaerolineae bacterium]
MSERVFFKLGGSLITDKTREQTPRLEVIRRLAREVGHALDARPDLQLLIGHGSGSYGHFVGQRYRTREGIVNDKSWRGYAETGTIAARLNRLVTDALVDVGLPVLAVQPSASALCHDGELTHLETRPIVTALENELVPLVYGDVALDQVRGCTIVSTEQIFCYLADRLHPQRIILAGVVDGVYDRDPLQDPAAQPIARISAENYAQVAQQLGGSHGVDVTGGMLSKVQEMVELARRLPGLLIHLITGEEPGRLHQTLLDAEAVSGTRIQWSG